MPKKVLTIMIYKGLPIVDKYGKNSINKLHKIYLDDDDNDFDSNNLHCSKTNIS